MTRRWLVVVLLGAMVVGSIAAPALAQGSDPAAGQKGAELRRTVRLAYANAFAVWELMGGAERMYSRLDTDYDAWRNLMSIQFLLAYAVETRTGLVKNLREALALAESDEAAHETARALLGEVKETAKQQAQVLGRAKDYLARMERDLRSAGRSEMAVLMATAHAQGPVTELGKLEVSTLLGDVEALVERTRR